MKCRGKRAYRVVSIAVIITAFLLLCSCTLEKDEESVSETESEIISEVVKEISNEETVTEEEITEAEEETKEEETVNEDNVVYSYYVNFINIDGTVLQRTVYETGEIPSYKGETPTYSDDSYTYNFTGWDKEIKAVGFTQTYTAVYSKTIKEKTISSSSKENPLISAPVANVLEYDGTEQELIAAGTIAGGTIEYKLEGGTYSVNIPKAKNAGNYTVYYRVTGNENYEDVNETAIAVTVTKKRINVVADNVSSYVASDLIALTYTNDALCGSDSFSGELSTAADKDVIGTYSILQNTLSAGENYEISFTSGSYTVKDKETQTLTFTNATDGKITKKYKIGEFTETVSGAKTTVTYSSSDETVATVDNTGKVTILKGGSAVIKAVAEGTSVYKEAEAQYALTITCDVTFDLKTEYINDSQYMSDCCYSSGMYYSWSCFTITCLDGSRYTTHPGTYLGGNSDKMYIEEDDKWYQMPYTFENVVSISREDAYIIYKIGDTMQPAHEFKNGIFDVEKDMTIIGTGVGQCIDENSMITMADGSLKAMKDIEVGDEVLSIDYETMTLVARKVIYTSKDEENYDSWVVPAYYKHTFSDGTVIKRAMRHRFYCLEDQGYKHMHTWENGLHAYSIDGTNPELVSTEVVYEELHYARITLEGSNNYFANGLSTGDSECCLEKVILNTKLSTAEK